MHQGGLSFQFLFNILYYDTIDVLSKTLGGISINGCTFNVFCYRDDFLLTSLTASGLQILINVATSYIESSRQTFNTSKITYV